MYAVLITDVYISLKNKSPLKLNSILNLDSSCNDCRGCNDGIPYFKD